MGLFRDELGRSLIRQLEDKVKDTAKTMAEEAKHAQAVAHIRKIVQECYQLAAEEANSDDPDKLLELARTIEHEMHGNARVYVDQAQADGHGIASVQDAHRAVAEVIAAIKTLICELDGEVTLKDQNDIRRVAGALAIKARAMLTLEKAKVGPRNEEGFAALFNGVEAKLMAYAQSSVHPAAPDAKIQRMRAAQAAIQAVFDLRMQHYAPKQAAA